MFRLPFTFGKNWSVLFYLFIFFRFQTNDPNNFTGVHQIWSETVKTAKLPLPQTTYIDFKNDSYMLPRPTVRRKQDCNGLVTLNFNKSTWNLLFQMRPFAEQAQDLLVPFTYLPIRDKCFIWSLIEARLLTIMSVSNWLFPNGKILYKEFSRYTSGIIRITI